MSKCQRCNGAMMRDFDGGSCINCGWCRPVAMEDNIDLAFWWEIHAKAEQGQLLKRMTRKRLEEGDRLRAMVQAEMKRNPNATGDQIAKAVGVTRRTVCRVKARLNA